MKKNKKKKKWLLLGVGVVLVIFVVYLAAQGKEAAQNMYSVVTAKRGDLDIYYSFSGNTEVDDAQHLTSPQSWKLAEINVNEGDVVKKGDVLYTVDQADYELAVFQAQSAISTAELALSSTQASQNQQVTQAQSTMNTAKMSMDDAQKTLENTQSLYESGLTSQQSYDQAKMAYDVAAEQYNAARVAYNTLANTSGISVASAQSQVEQAKNSYDTLVKQIGDREVKAEMDGIVSKIYVNTGVTLNAGTVVMDILDTNSVQAVVKVDEYDYSTMQVGNEVTVYIDALGLEVPGKVSSIDMQATAASGMAYFNAEVEFEHDSSVLGGMSVEVKSLKDSAKDTVLISMDALLFDKLNQPYVQYKDEKGKLQTKYVTVGINDGMTAEIIEGVSEGEQLYYIDMSAYYQMMNMMGGQ